MEETLTKAERAELRSLIRRRAKVAKQDVDARKDALLADFEEQLAEEFRADDERWLAVTEAAHRAVEDANRELDEIFDRLEVQRDLRPRVHATFRQRWDIAERKAQLRKVAHRRVEAMASQAKLVIDREAVSIEGRLAATALVSSDAAEWLASLPQVDELVHALDIAAVRAELESGGKFS